MIVVQVGDDHGIDGGRIATHGPDRFGGVAQDGAVAPGGFADLIAGVDNDPAVAIFEQPYEVVHAVGQGGVIVEDETVAAYPCVTIGVFQRPNRPECAHDMLLPFPVSLADAPVRSIRAGIFLWGKSR